MPHPHLSHSSRRYRKFWGCACAGASPPPATTSTDESMTATSRRGSALRRLARRRPAISVESSPGPLSRSRDDSLLAVARLIPTRSPRHAALGASVDANDSTYATRACHQTSIHTHENWGCPLASTVGTVGGVIVTVRRRRGTRGRGSGVDQTGSPRRRGGRGRRSSRVWKRRAGLEWRRRVHDRAGS